MTKKHLRCIIALVSALILMITQFVFVIPILADEAPKQAPTLLFTDDFEHGNDLKVTYDSSIQPEVDSNNVVTEIAETVDEETGSTNKTFKLTKTSASAASTTKFLLFPQTQDGEYALANEGNEPESGKTYRYIIEYDYCIMQLEGNSGMYISTCFAPNTGTFSYKNNQGSCLLNGRLYMQDIGRYNMFNLKMTRQEWQTASTTTYYSSTDGLSGASVALYFELWKEFSGTLLIDNIKVYRVADGDQVGTVIFDAVDDSTTSYNAVSYVVGAPYDLPVPQKEKYEFAGWYTDEDYTEICENTVPENKINGRYTILYARWIDKTLVDDFNQESAENRVVNGNFSIEQGSGVKDTAALKFSSSGSSSGKIIPKGIEGKSYKLDAVKGTEYKYVVKFDYKAESTASELKLSFDLVNASTNAAIADKQGEFTVSPTLGNADGTWRKAAFTLRFTAKEAAEATIAINFSAAGNADILIDNIELQLMPGRIGSVKFNSDEYIGYIDPVAGEYNDLTAVEITEDRAGYVFAGWYSGDTKVDVTKFDDKDYTVTPKWEQLTAIENTQSLMADNFDQEDAFKRNVYDDVIVGPDTSEDGWYTDDFQQYGDSIDIYSNYGNQPLPDDLKITVEEEADGNKFLRFKNIGSTHSTQNFIFRDANGDPLYNKTLQTGKKYTVIYKFRYKVDAAPDFGIWMDTVLCNDNKTSVGTASTSHCFICMNNSSRDDAYVYGINDGNWHTVSFAAVFTVNDSTQKVTPGLRMTYGTIYGARKVNICFDEVSVKFIESSASSSGAAVTYKLAQTPRGADEPVISVMDAVAAECGTGINFPTPVADGYEFLGWTNVREKIVSTAPASPTSSKFITVYPKWKAVETNAVSSVIEYQIKDGLGTGGTKGLKVSASSKGQGAFNLRNSDGIITTKEYNTNDKINWIVRFRYKALNAGNGIKMDFDVAVPESDESLSVEGGSAASITIGGSNTNADGKWHTASIAVSLTRSAVNERAPVTLLVKLDAASAFSSVYFDEFEVFDAGSNGVSTFVFSSSKFVDPIAGVAGTDAVLPGSPFALYSIGGWYNDERYLDLFAKPGESVKFAAENLTLYGEVLTYDGFYATERFDNTRDIYVERMNENSYNQYRWDNYGLYGKWRIFQITDEDCHDENGVGKALKFDTRDEKFAGDPAATICLTDGISDQICVGTTHDEELKMYIVSFWYKLVSVDTDLNFTLSVGKYDYHWENSRKTTETVKFPVLSTTDGEWRQMQLLIGLDNAEEDMKLYLKFAVSGQALAYFDDFEVTQVKSGKGQFIIFDTDGGNNIVPYVGEAGTPIPELPVPVKENSIFKGWYTDFAYEKPFVDTVFGEETLYLNALWEEITAGGGDGDGSGSNLTEDIIIEDDEIEESYERPYYIEYEYEDILEEYEVEYNRKKTVLTKTKVPGTEGSGLSWVWILVIVVASVAVVGGVTTLIIVKVRKKKTIANS